jgi:hypothetical protein
MFRLLLNLNFLAVDGTLWAKAVSELSKGIFNLFDSKIFARCSGRERKLQLIWHQTSAGLFIVQNKEFLQSKQCSTKKSLGIGMMISWGRWRIGAGAAIGSMKRMSKARPSVRTQSLRVALKKVTDGFFLFFNCCTRFHSSSVSSWTSLYYNSIATRPFSKKIVLRESVKVKIRATRKCFKLLLIPKMLRFLTPLSGVRSLS